MDDGRVRIRSRKTAGRIQKISLEPVPPTNMCQPLLNVEPSGPYLQKVEANRTKKLKRRHKPSRQRGVQGGRRICTQQRAV